MTHFMTGEVSIIIIVSSAYPGRIHSDRLHLTAAETGVLLHVAPSVCCGDTGDDEKQPESKNR